MKKSIIFIPVIIILVVAAVFLYPYVDAYQHTTYATQFNQDQFDSIVVGKSIADVKQMIGEPFKTTADPALNTEYYFYSQSENDSSYFLKKLVLQNGAVIEKVDELYID